eukprot:5601688-Alexandrium_andersonii.AAC.1
MLGLPEAGARQIGAVELHRLRADLVATGCACQCGGGALQDHRMGDAARRVDLGVTVLLRSSEP